MNACRAIFRFVICFMEPSSVFRLSSFVFRLSVPLCALFLTGCGDSSLDPMVDQPREKPLRPSAFYQGDSSSRPLIPGTVTTDGLVIQAELAGGVVPRGPERFAQAYAHPAENFPFPITRQDLLRGQEQFNIFCAPCHGRTGDGHGMIVARGLTPPPTYHSPRLRQAPVGHFYDVITHGYGAMYSYNERVAADDRWRIAAYIRALQLSQNAPLAQLSDHDRQEIQRVP